MATKSIRAMKIARVILRGATEVLFSGCCPRSPGAASFVAVSSMLSREQAPSELSAEQAFSEPSSVRLSLGSSAEQAFSEISAELISSCVSFFGASSFITFVVHLYWFKQILIVFADCQHRENDN